MFLLCPSDVWAASETIPNGKVGSVVPASVLHCSRHELTRFFVEHAYPVFASTLPHASMPESRFPAPMQS